MYKHIFFYCAFCLYIATSCKKEDPTNPNIKTEPKNFVCNDALLSTDGSCFIIAGSTYVSSTDINISIQKINILTGEVLWNTIIGGSGTDKSYRIIETADAYLIGGISNTAPALNFDLHLSKLDKNGNILWSHIYGGANDETIGNMAIQSNGDIIISGTTNSYGAGSRDIILYKIDAAGNEISHITYGGALNDGSSDLINHRDTLYVLGYTNNLGHGDRDMWLLCVDNNLDTTWTKTIGTVEYEEAGRIHLTSDKNILLCGHTGTFPMHSGFLGKYDLQGNAIFEKKYGAGDHDGFEDCIQSSNNTIMCVGYTSSYGNQEQAYMVKTDTNGNLISTDYSGDNSNQRLYKVLEDGSTFYFLGNTDDNDAYIQKASK